MFCSAQQDGRKKEIKTEEDADWNTINLTLTYTVSTTMKKSSVRPAARFTVAVSYFTVTQIPPLNFLITLHILHSTHAN